MSAEPVRHPLCARVFPLMTRIEPAQRQAHRRELLDGYGQRLEAMVKIADLRLITLFGRPVRWIWHDRAARLAPLTGGKGAMCDEDERVRSLASIAYVVLGCSSAPNTTYAHLTTVSQVGSALVATALWPLILFGASLHLNLGQLRLVERCPAGPHHVHGSSRSAQF